MCNGYWDRRTYASDVHLMTSRELTSGFDFWSRGHLRMAVMHLFCKIWCRFLYPVRSYWHFSEIQDDGRRHLGFSDYVNLAIRVCWQCGICVLYQIGLKYVQWLLRSTHLCFRCSFDDVTRINFRFRLLVTWSSPRRRGASSHIIWCKISLSSPKLLTFFRNSRWRPPLSWILCEFGHSGVLTVWYLCYVPNLVQIYVIVTEIDAHMLRTLIWWRHTN